MRKLARENARNHKGRIYIYVLLSYYVHLLYEYNKTLGKITAVRLKLNYHANMVTLVTMVTNSDQFLLTRWSQAMVTMVTLPYKVTLPW